MSVPVPRRDFLKTSAAVGLGAGLGRAALGLAPASASAMAVKPESVRFRPEIEPVVRMIEDTSREKAIEAVLDAMKKGLSYRDLMAGLFLAGIRDIQPRPVGFKFHAVMVIHSAHLLAQSAGAEDRLLPMLWALDNFKNSQAQDVKEGDWTLSAVDEGHLPSPSQAKSALVEAMDAWDADKADSATAALCRSAGAAEVMEPFWRYGVRDFRDIGHKAIFAAQSWRTLQAIGWPHAEPVLRSLAFGLLDRRGQPGRNAEGPYEANLENAKKVRDGWTVGKDDPEAARSLLETLRTASPEAACSEAVALLNRGIAPESLWDSVVLFGSEQLLKKPGIVPLHAMTSANALHFIFGASGDDLTRKLSLLQAVGWQTLFRDASGAKGDMKLDGLEPADSPSSDAVAEVFSTIKESRPRAASRALAFLARGGSVETIFAEGRSLIFRKGRDSHDYKYAAAAWEEARLASDPRWHAPLAAASLAYVPSPEAPDSPLMNRAREALKGLGG